MPAPSQKPTTNAVENSRLVASAIDGALWFGVGKWKRLAIFLCVFGLSSLPLSVADLPPGRFFWVIAAFLALLVGVVLAYVPRTTNSKPEGDVSGDI
jgi:hypothetical protein